MSEDNTYINEDGQLVFTSTYLLAKKTCCRSGCLHCPYGFTLKKFGLRFEDWSEERAERFKEIIHDSGEAAFSWEEFVPENRKFVLIKDTVCGVLVKNHIVVKRLWLRPHFKNQGLSKEMVESHLF